MTPAVSKSGILLTESRKVCHRHADNANAFAICFTHTHSRVQSTLH